MVQWKKGNSLEAIAGQDVRFKFYMTNGKLYSFWVSADENGKSGGAIAAGGPGFSGTWDK
ncbi:hypothetical protein Poly41_12170 [Novipirellula artificiosorum]|uniref:Uncharacterized protein n=1 Tax=Novipirellula artificiosorum TaxID=2528016 RepID=A0A5C6DVL6_9BACT|nr:hypothetical protein Poly41_12170 [Novipirellula artificiosorum]